MSENTLYLNIYTNNFEDGEIESDCQLFVPWHTVLVLYVLEQGQVFDSTTCPSISFMPTDVTDSDDVFPIKKVFVERIKNISYQSTALDPIVDACSLPIMKIPEKNFYITGLCSVLRCLIKEVSPHFLGYLEGCLKAPAEASPWTRFCEVDLSKAIIKLFSNEIDDVMNVPIDFARFEAHLQSPARIHNLRKRMQTDQVWLDECRQTSVNHNNLLEQYAKWIHIFAEGPDCFLSDLLIFPHIHLLLKQISFSISEQAYEALLPNTSRWYEKMKHSLMSDKILESILDVNSLIIGAAAVNLILPSVTNKSLYKLETNRGSSRKTYTRQNGVEKVVSKLSENLSIDIRLPSEDFEPLFSNEPLDWSTLPKAVHPLEGNLPPDRVSRKCEQLENMASAVVNIAKKGSTIVDFCSGGGHLGILLAYLLPDSTIVLLENKAESLDQAIKRIMELDLKNCIVFQGNMSNFLGKFDVGTSLHACGVATDLVISACTRVSASFVVCPCCYGSLQETPSIRYPRSQHFLTNDVTLEDFLILGHTADQTEENTDKLFQGMHAMNVVDTDRINFIKESGYQDINLFKMKPMTSQGIGTQNREQQKMQLPFISSHPKMSKVNMQASID